MRCSRVEKNLYLLSEGLADQKLEADISAHVRSCKRCGRLLVDLRAMNEILTEAPDAALIPENEVEEMVSAGLRRRKPLPRECSQYRLNGNGIPVPGFATACVVLLALVAVVLYSVLVLYPNTLSRRNSVAAAGAQDERRVVAVSRASTLCLGQNCTVYLHKGSTCAILRAEETVVIIDLRYGEILLAARKGMYDTIAIHSGTAKVYATGTHFGVDRSSDILSVSVLEGKVKVVYAGEKETPVSALETCVLNTKENTSKTERISASKRQQMMNEFAAMATGNTEWGLADGLPGKNIDDNALFNRPKLPYTPRQNRNAADDNAAKRQYSMADKLIQKDNYASAAVAIEDYLKKYNLNADSAWFDLAFCYTNLRRYDDAIDAYHIVVDAGVNEQLVETALHRSNKILYVKLKEYDEARCGIERYLKKYPLGRWREEEFYYGIQIALAQGNANRADSLTNVFAGEFPGNCRTQELLKKVEPSRP
jgi:TolA-binding protein